MSALAIACYDLCKSFAGKVAVDKVSIEQPRGSVYGFLGPNGSGKTTCLRMMCGLVTVDSGRGQCLGFDILTQSRQIKNRTGYMTQQFSFWGDLTVRENLNLVAKLYQLPNKPKLLDVTLANLGLEKRQHELAQGLSGGWKQRLALAAVTLHQPQLLLLDEPTAGVDPQARRDFWQQIQHLAREGMTVLVSTHYMDEAERCDKIVYLAHGKLLTVGTVDEIIRHAHLVALSAPAPANARALIATIAEDKAVENVLFYGGRIHVVGTDERTLAAFETGAAYNLNWQRERPSLDDAFIALEKQTGGDQR